MFKSPMQEIPRILFGMHPTPLVELKKLSKFLNGPRIFIKRDDIIIPFGGNKIRKLEYICADALQKGFDTILTSGGQQSNYCRQTAACCAMCNLKCHIVVSGPKPAHLEHNLFLMKLYGAELHFNDKPTESEKFIDSLKSNLIYQGLKPYIVPCGGSTDYGTLGYANGFIESQNQLDLMGEKVNFMVVAAATAGTQAGLILGAQLQKYHGKIIGIQADEKIPYHEYSENVKNLVIDSGKLCKTNIEKSELNVVYDSRFTGKGYEKAGSLEEEAIRICARMEGILLDPVYSGRAMGGLFSMIKNGELTNKDSVLFWHTGGGPNIFIHSNQLENIINDSK